MAVVQEHNRAPARAVRLDNDNCAPLGCESLIEFVLIYFGIESSFELLLHDFVVNRVRKQGKCRCLLASIRLAEVLFAQQKASLIL